MLLLLPLATSVAMVRALPRKLTINLAAKSLQNSCPRKREMFYGILVVGFLLNVQCFRPNQPSLVYINGYLADTTDIEMKRIVTLAGGQILYATPLFPTCEPYN